MKGSAARYVVTGLVSMVIILLDQATKLHIMQTMRLYESFPVIPDFFNITYIRNPGAAFGLFASSGSVFRLVFFGTVTVGALLLLGVYFYRLREDDWAGHVGGMAILGGAVGNLLDRLRHGEVIDFLDFYVGAYHWPAFNVADTAICIGVSLFVLHFVLEKKRETSSANE